MYPKHLEGPLPRLSDIAEQSREGQAAFFSFFFFLEQIYFGTNIFFSSLGVI